MRMAPPDEDTFAVLVEGIPGWLRGSLEEWAKGVIALGKEALAKKYDRRFRTTLPQIVGQERLTTYWGRASEDERLALVDFLLFSLQEEGASSSANSQQRQRANNLQRMLIEAGSLWTVTFEPYWGLTHRATEGAQKQVEAVTAGTTDAAREVAKAWQACYRQDPDYDRAYDSAVLAIEAAVLPHTSPKDGLATLGKALSHMRDTSTKWSVAGSQIDGVDAVVALLEAVWTNQERHAKNTGAVVAAQREETEFVVSAAVTIVQWFSAGLITKL